MCPLSFSMCLVFCKATFAREEDDNEEDETPSNHKVNMQPGIMPNTRQSGPLEQSFFKLGSLRLWSKRFPSKFQGKKDKAKMVKVYTVVANYLSL